MNGNHWMLIPKDKDDMKDWKNEKFMSSSGLRIQDKIKIQSHGPENENVDPSNCFIVELTESQRTPYWFVLCIFHFTSTTAVKTLRQLTKKDKTNEDKAGGSDGRGHCVLYK